MKHVIASRIGHGDVIERFGKRYVVDYTYNSLENEKRVVVVSHVEGTDIPTMRVYRKNHKVLVASN